MGDASIESKLSGQMAELLRDLRLSRPEERSEKARRWAIAITEMEKVFAYFNTYVANEDIEAFYV